MSKENDKVILELKQKIEVKKSELKKTKKFTPVTNSSLELNGNRYNIQTLGKSDVITFLVTLNSLASSAEELGLLKEFKLSGYNVMDWLSDLKSRLDILNVKDEEKKLNEMEKTLATLLSEDKKTEMELEKIKSMLE